jgi:hypothetical protein
MKNDSSEMTKKTVGIIFLRDGGPAQEKEKNAIWR